MSRFRGRDRFSADYSVAGFLRRLESESGGASWEVIDETASSVTYRCLDPVFDGVDIKSIKPFTFSGGLVTVVVEKGIAQVVVELDVPISLSTSHDVINHAFYMINHLYD